MHKVRQAIRKHRKLLSACAMVLAVALMFWAVNSPAIVGVSAAKRVLPIYSVQRDDRVVSLTTFGRRDLRAVLKDADGRLVERLDDRADDWNIGLSRRLLP